MAEKGFEGHYEGFEDRKIPKVTVQSDLVYAPRRRFLPMKAKEIIRSVLREKLTGLVYDGEAASGWVRDISDTIKLRLKEMEMERYKIVVQATIGELTGQGLQMTCRCFWDPKVDDCAEGVYIADNIFGAAVAFAIYYY